MIANFLLFIVNFWLVVIHFLLSAIPIHTPPQVTSSVAYFGSYLGYAGGIIDMPGTMTAFQYLLDFMMAWFTFKVILWAYHLIAAKGVHEKQALPAQNKGR